jgi:hypothetical protein
MFQVVGIFIGIMFVLIFAAVLGYDITNLFKK